MPNPVEILVRTSRRIAQVAAARTFAYAILPALVAAALAAFIRPLGRATWERWGYVLNAGPASILAGSLAVIAVLSILVAGAFALRAYLKARDFVAAAEQVDDAVGGHQQILTFAALADPAGPESAKSQRSPLFPVLWKRAAAFLGSFDPNRAFPFNLGQPITRSSIFALGIAAAMILATLGLVRPPTPLQTEAQKLREIAGEIEKSSSSADDIALANSIRDAADALDNPKLPPEEKKKRVEEVMQQMASHSDQRQGGGKEKGQGSGGGSSAQNGKGNGKGAGQGQGGSGNSGSGAGQNQQGKGAGAGQNDKGSQGKNNIELQNELAKAEAQIESDESKNPNNSSEAGGDQNKGQNQQAGSKPDEKMPGNEPNPKEPGNIPKPGNEGNQNVPQAGGNQQAGKDQGSNMGDTHLGEFPTPTKTQRFLKPGEKGAALNIHDARYVMFRLPSAIPVGSGGTTVIDPNRTKATTPYVNAPLKETSNDAPPDERQLVPPRYRDLIH